jgi:Tfp pilus assembly protein PilV
MIIINKTIKAFIILEAIISLLIVSFCILAINSLLLAMLNYLANSKTQTKDFYLTKNLEACYVVYNNYQLCEAQFFELPK